MIDHKKITIAEALKNNMKFYIICSDEEEGYININNEIEYFDTGTGGYDLLGNMLLFSSEEEAKKYLQEHKPMDMELSVYSFTISKEVTDLNGTIDNLTNLDIEWE